MNRPLEALCLPMMISRKNDETLIAKTDMGLVGEILFDRMDTLKNSIQATRPPVRRRGADGRGQDLRRSLQPYCQGN